MTETNASSTAGESAPKVEPAVILQQQVAEAPSSAPPPSPPPARASEDQLPTSRFPSLPSVFPPPVERALAADLPLPSFPHVAVTTNEEREAKTALHPKHRSGWRGLLFRATRVAGSVPGQVAAAGRAAWSQERVGALCGVLGLAMIVASLVFGVATVTGAKVDKPEHLALVVAVVLARAAISIATMCVGYAVLRVGERLSFPARS